MSLRLVSYGPSAALELEAALAGASHGDPLAPVAVVVPSAFAGVTLRRRSARPGLLNVRFTSLPQLITATAGPELLTDGRLPMTGRVQRGVARAVLHHATGRLRAANLSAATTGVLAGLFAELDEAEPTTAELERLAAHDEWAAEVVALYRRYLTAAESYARRSAVVDSAIAAIARPARPTPTMLHLPRRLARAELRFLRALAQREALDVILGFTGEPVADQDATAMIKALTEFLDVASDMRSAGPASSVLVQSLPDAEEEVRVAVRRTLEHLSTGRAAGARVALVYRSAVPYARLIDEQLSAAGLPHHQPRQRSLRPP